ncbi:MAG: Crp/Fnr family transcriptional regulator [Alphaproteobacteria bacterium]|nr:Crp/Fnr family transcriptional regulator [Alphaproteobacteria bacterium]
MHGTVTDFVPDILHRCDHCAVRHQAVCGAMDEVQIKKLAQIAHRKKIPAGQTIISDEEPVDFFANVISGAVKLTKTLPDGRQQIVGLLFPPDFLGRAFSKSNPYTAEAATDVEICTFPNMAFERLVGEYPGLQERLFKHTLDELDAARDWMLLLGRKTAEEKVSSFLYLLAKRSLMLGCPHRTALETATFELPLTRSDVADYLGLTIETVSRQLTRLKTSNVIRLSSNRLIMVPDMARLAHVAGQEFGQH